MPSVSIWYPQSRVCKSCIVSQRRYCSHGETICGWHCAQTGETCSSTRIRREKTKGSNFCGPLNVIESQKRADAWERIWPSDDGNGLSKYRRWSEWPRENTRCPLSHSPSQCFCIVCTPIIHKVLGFGRERGKIFLVFLWYWK